MKQFQVVQQEPDLNNGLIVANFGLPILIAPNSQIALDKFQATIEQSSTNIILGDQTILLTTDGITELPVVIPAQQYANISSLIVIFNNYINSAFNAWVGGNEGLIFSTQNVSNKIEFSFEVVEPIVEEPTTLSQCTLNDNIYIYSGGMPLAWSGSTGVGVLNGGGFNLTCQMRPDKVGGQYTLEFGLEGNIAGQTGQIIKISQALAASPSSFGVVTLSSTTTGQTVPVPSAIFVNNPTYTFFVSFYQYNGYYACRIEAKDSNDVTQDSYIYQGQALGAWSSLDTSIPFFSGTSINITQYSPLNTNPGFGDFNMTSLGGPAGGVRTVILNFDKAEQLRLGFGILSDIAVLAPTNSDKGAYTSNTVINFSPIRSALSLSIEVMELPLESYLVGSSPYQTKNPTKGTRQQGSRVNVIGYFVPEIVDIASNIYRYQASEYQWLDIVNKQPMEFTSLNFRVYVTETNQPLQATNLSFNFLTRTNDEFLNKNDNKKYIA